MGLSRLDNFLKSTRGTILYVDPGSLDSTDSIEIKEIPYTRPFKTIQRALIESADFLINVDLITIGLEKQLYWFIPVTTLWTIDPV